MKTLTCPLVPVSEVVGSEWIKEICEGGMVPKGMWTDFYYHNLGDLVDLAEISKSRRITQKTYAGMRLFVSGGILNPFFFIFQYL